MYTLTCFVRDEGLDPPRLIAKGRLQTLKEALARLELCFCSLAGNAREITATVTFWSPSEDVPEPAPEPAIA